MHLPDPPPSVDRHREGQPGRDAEFRRLLAIRGTLPGRKVVCHPARVDGRLVPPQPLAASCLLPDEPRVAYDGAQVVERLRHLRTERIAGSVADVDPERPRLEPEVEV